MWMSGPPSSEFSSSLWWVRPDFKLSICHCSRYIPYILLQKSSWLRCVYLDAENKIVFHRFLMSVCGNTVAQQLCPQVSSFRPIQYHSLSALNWYWFWWDWSLYKPSVKALKCGLLCQIHCTEDCLLHLCLMSSYGHLVILWWTR